MYTESSKQHLLCENPFLGWVGGGSALYYWLFFQYLSVDTMSIFFLSFDVIKFSVAGLVDVVG